MNAFDFFLCVSFIHGERLFSLLLLTVIFVACRFIMNRSETCWLMSALWQLERTVPKVWSFRALHCTRLVKMWSTSFSFLSLEGGCQPHTSFYLL